MNTGLIILAGIFGVLLIVLFYYYETQRIKKSERINDLDQINKALKKFVEEGKQPEIVVTPTPVIKEELTQYSTPRMSEAKKKPYKKRGPKGKNNVRRKDQTTK